MRESLRLLSIVAAFAAGVSNFYGATVSIVCPAGTYGGPFTVLSNIAGGSLPDNLFPNAYIGTLATQWNPQAQNYDAFTKVQLGGPHFHPLRVPMTVQNGFFVYSASDMTFNWSIPDDPPPPPPPLNLESNKYYLRGPLFYGMARYADIVGAPPANETTLFRFVGGPTGYIWPPRPPWWQAYHFIDGAWTPSEPVLNPLEAAFIVYPTLRIKAAITGAPPVMVLTWPRGRLESAAQVSGPWLEVTNAQPPYVVDAGAATEVEQYYRVREWP